MEIEQRNFPTRGSFIAKENEVEAGKLTYSWSGADTFILLHTEVAPAFGGQGIGKQLVMAAVDHARTNGLKIIVKCPFAKRVFERGPELQDVLHS
jgi:predicted GNAT family acetyltransferase